MKGLLALLRTLAWAALAAAIYQELRRPPEERTWHGKVAGVVPYDFRIPAPERLRRAYWDPDSDQVFSDHVFGVGWAINIPVAVRRLNELARQYVAVSRSVADGIERRMPRCETTTSEDQQEP